MSSSESSASLSNSPKTGTSVQPQHRRIASTHGLNSYRDDCRHGQNPAHSITDRPQPVGRSSSAYSRGPATTGSEEGTWPEFLHDHRTTPLMDAGGPQPYGASNSNVERKRRLTNSAHNSGRVRTVSGGFHSRNPSSHVSNLDGSSSAGLHQTQRVEPRTYGPPRAHLSDRALATTPPTRRRSSNMQRPGSAAQEIILPKWQPDSEVSECPICSRQFTFWFRKHHCRKCGRVVCASCSPHRITIPRQFMVHPPESTNRLSTTATRTSVVIDLTGEAGSPGRSDVPPSWASPRRTSNPGLGGGEEVRLCNPCVPDPQPNPQATMDLAEFLRQGSARNEGERALNQLHPSRSLNLGSGQALLYGQHSSPDAARELRRQRGRGMIVCANEACTIRSLMCFYSFSLIMRI
jgi:FYVE zinc finger